MPGPELSERLREALNTGTKPVAESHRFDEGALERWMRVNVPGLRGPIVVRQFKGGQSNPTYQIVTPGMSYVLRRKPPGLLLPSAHAVDREYYAMTALEKAGFPAPRTFGLCTNEAVIGTWFYLMEMVEGRILWDQTLPLLEPAERHAIFVAKIRTLADLHNLDPAAIGLADYGKPGNYMGRQVARWTRQYRASMTQPVPEMEWLIKWLPSTLPAQDRTSLVHGDYRLDNMILHATEPRVAAVLDWELSTLGDPLADFAYFLVNWVSGPLSDLADLETHGIPTLQEAVEIYCRHTDRSHLPDLNWYFAYCHFRMAGITQGIAGRVRDGTANSPEATEAEGRVAPLARTAWDFAMRAGATSV